MRIEKRTQVNRASLNTKLLFKCAWEERFGMSEGVKYRQDQFACPECYPHCYVVRVNCSRVSEIYRTPDVEMTVGLPSGYHLDAVAIVFDWCSLRYASSVVVFYRAVGLYVPDVYLDCTFDGEQVSYREKL